MAKKGFTPEQIINKLRHDDAITGTVGVHTREDKMIGFHARSVIGNQEMH